MLLQIMEIQIVSLLNLLDRHVLRFCTWRKQFDVVHSFNCSAFLSIGVPAAAWQLTHVKKGDEIGGTSVSCMQDGAV